MRTRPWPSSVVSTAPAKMNRSNRRAPSSVIGQRRDLVGERVPAGPGVDRQAVLEPARDDETRVQLGAEPRRDGEPSLVVHRVPVLAGEHLTGFPTSGAMPGRWPARARCGRGRCSPLWATSHHFGHHSAPRAARQWGFGNRPSGRADGRIGGRAGRRRRLGRARSASPAGSGRAGQRVGVGIRSRSPAWIGTRRFGFIARIRS